MELPSRVRKSSAINIYGVYWYTDVIDDRVEAMDTGVYYILVHWRVYRELPIQYLTSDQSNSRYKAHVSVYCM